MRNFHRGKRGGPARQKCSSLHVTVNVRNLTNIEHRRAVHLQTCRGGLREHVTEATLTIQRHQRGHQRIRRIPITTLVTTVQRHILQSLRARHNHIQQILHHRHTLMMLFQNRQSSIQNRLLMRGDMTLTQNRNQCRQHLQLTRMSIHHQTLTSLRGKRSSNRAQLTRVQNVQVTTTRGQLNDLATHRGDFIDIVGLEVTRDQGNDAAAIHTQQHMTDKRALTVAWKTQNEGGRVVNNAVHKPRNRVTTDRRIRINVDTHGRARERGGRASRERPHTADLAGRATPLARRLKQVRGAATGNHVPAGAAIGTRLRINRRDDERLEGREEASSARSFRLVSLGGIIGDDSTTTHQNLHTERQKNRYAEILIYRDLGICINKSPGLRNITGLTAPTSPIPAEPYGDPAPHPTATSQQTPHHEHPTHGAA